MNDQEFLRIIQELYGNNIDDKLMNQLNYTRRSNPQYLIQSYRQKKGMSFNPISIIPNSIPTPQQSTIPSKINISASTPDPSDLSNIASFNEAFKIARQRGLKEFKWKQTKGNPSGRFGTALASEPKATPQVQTTQPQVTNSPNRRQREATNAFNKNMLGRGFYCNPKTNMWSKPQQKQQPTARMWTPDYIKGMTQRGFKWNSKTNMWDWTKQTPMKQQGGSLEKNQEAFVAYLIEVSGAQNQQELNDFIQSLGEDGLKQQYQQFLQVMENGTRSAKNGAKLNYIKSLRGVCPEGFELGYFKEGGQICAKCVEKREKMGGIPFRPMQGEKGTKLVQDFKKDLKNKKDKITITKKKPEKKELGGELNFIEFFKCGGKKSKSKKKENGGLVEKKSGIPIKERFIEKDKCGKKMKKKK